MKDPTPAPLLRQCTTHSSWCRTKNFGAYLLPKNCYFFPFKCSTQARKRDLILATKLEPPFSIIVLLLPHSQFPAPLFTPPFTIPVHDSCPIYTTIHHSCAWFLSKYMASVRTYNKEKMVNLFTTIITKNTVFFLHPHDFSLCLVNSFHDLSWFLSTSSRDSVCARGKLYHNIHVTTP